MTKKKLAVVVCSVALMLSLVISGTIAYLTDSADVTNTFTMGDIDITLEEPSWDDTTDGKDILPGDSFVKDPTVTAVKGDSYIRFKVEFFDLNTNAVITDAARIAAILDCVCYDDTYVPANNAVDPVVVATPGTDIVEGTSYTSVETAAFASINPAFVKDTANSSDTNGTYYYTCATEFTKGTSDVLFTNIVVPSDYTNTQLQLLGAFSLKITAQAIQSDGFADADTAFAALPL